MGLKTCARGSESRLTAYVEAITSAFGHADRAALFQSYCAGLLLPASAERRADGRAPASGARAGGAPVAAPLRGEGRVIR